MFDFPFWCSYSSLRRVKTGQESYPASQLYVVFMPFWYGGYSHQKVFIFNLLQFMFVTV